MEMGEVLEEDKIKGSKYFLFLLGLVGALILCTPFATENGFVNGLVIEKVFWFQLVMAFFCCIFLFWGILARVRLLRWSVPDTLVLFLAGITLGTYHWQLNPEPEKLLFGGQLVVLWFGLRMVIHNFPEMRGLLLFVMATTGLVEAMIGMRQLHGLEGSNHSLFNLTGTFFNPGPYSGYLAVIVPVCLSIALSSRKALSYYMWICTLAMLVVLPAGMSRSAYIAVACSCGWVYWRQQIGWKRTKNYIHKYKKTVFSLFVIISLLLACALAGLYQLKKDSADGRLQIWKVTSLALLEKPIQGVGLGGFPAAYAKAQADYFSSGMGSEREKLVAGCPEYAFNEYLQIGTEQGVGGLVVFVLWLVSMCYGGIKSRQIGAVGGIMALAVFAFSSYPLQLPEFWILLVVLGGICVTTSDTFPASSREGKVYIWTRIIVVLVSLYGMGLFYAQSGRYEVNKQWNRMQMIYTNKGYQAVVDDYVELHPLMKHKPEFLFEEGQCLSKTGRNIEAVHVLERATELSADPMIWYMLAKNEQTLKNYRKAEDLLLHAINILPERIYPYYLLTLLYAEPNFSNPEKLQQAARAVLAKEPKVDSRAIREMREEVVKIMK